jgi:hypothetical protein
MLPGYEGGIVDDGATARESLPPAGEMLRLLSGFVASQALHVCARLGIADLLAEGPRRVEDLARESRSHGPSLERLLRYLASIGVVREERGGGFSLTALGDALRTASPFSVHAAAVLFGARLFWDAVGDLHHSVATGGDAFARAHGRSFFDHLARHPDAAAAFDAWMTRSSEMDVAALLAAYDFSPFSTIVDVGGGHGTLLAGVLSAYPDLRGILFDLPRVVSGATAVEAVAERCRRIGGSFFEAVPSGGDAYLLQHVLQDWSDERALEILGSCRRVLGSDGRLVVIEALTPADGRPEPHRYLDLLLMALCGGRQRGEREFRQLLEQSGLRLTRVIAMDSPSSILEAVPA